MNFIYKESGVPPGGNFLGGVYYGEKPYPDLDDGWPTDRNTSYGKYCLADYFAENFAGTVISSNGVPQPSGMWMAVYIDLTK